MKYRIFLLLYLFIAFSSCMYGQVYKTQPLSPEIHTIQVNAGGDWQRLPIIQLNNNDYHLAACRFFQSRD